MDKNSCETIRKKLKRFVFGGCKKVGKDEVIHSKLKDSGWGLRSFEVVWAQLVAKWTIRVLKMENTTIINLGRKYMDENSHLTPRNPISTGHGKSVKRNQIYNCENIWENSCKIIGWITQKILGKSICFDHQPLLYNPMISKQGKMITENDLPEFDFGDKLDVRTLKENRIEIFGGEDELAKKLTRKIFLKLNLSPVRNFPECDDRRCRPPMHEVIFRKNFLRDIIRSAFFNDKVDTGSKVKA